MLSDDEFLAQVMPYLEEKSAAQGRTGESSHHPSSGSTSPKNDPAGGLLFPITITAMTKFGHTVTTDEHLGSCVPLGSEDFPDVDGILRLEIPYMNVQSERITLSNFEKFPDVVRVTVVGLDAQPARIYQVDFPMFRDSGYSKTKQLVAKWRVRWQCRGGDGNSRSKAVEEKSSWISEERLKREFFDSMKSERRLWENQVRYED